MKENIATRFFQVLFVICLFSLPLLLRGYSLPISNNMIYILLNLSGILALLCKRHMKYSKVIDMKYFILLIWILICNFLIIWIAPYSKGINDTSFHNFIMFVDAMILLYISVKGVLNTDFFIRVYKWIVYFAMVFIVIQFIGYMIFHIKISGKIPFLEYSDAVLFDRSILISSGFIRCSSFFLEPSHYAQFMMPYICLSLYGYKDIIKKSLLSAIVLSGTLVMSVSGTAIILLSISWGVYFLQSLKGLPRKKVIRFVVGIIFFMILCAYAISLPGTQAMLISMQDSGTIKTSVRVTRGFIIFSKLPLFEKLFGIGFQNISSAGRWFGIPEALSIRNGHNEYVNDFCMFLLSYGLCGMFQVVMILKTVIIGSNKQQILLAMILLAVFLSEATLGPLWLFFMCLGIAVFKVNSNEY